MVKVIKNNKEKLIVEMTSDGDIIINQRRFTLHKAKTKKIGTIEHTTNMIYKEIKEGESERYKEIIVDALKNEVSKEHLLKELINSYPIKHLKKMAKRIREKKKIERHDGCLGFKCGDTYLQLIE